MFYTSFDTEGPWYEEGDAPFSNFYVSPTLVYLEEPFKSRLSGNNPGQRFPIPALSPNVSFASFQPLSGSPGYQLTNVTPLCGGLQFHHSTRNFQIDNYDRRVCGYARSPPVLRHGIQPWECRPNASRFLNLFNAAGESGPTGAGLSGEDTIYTYKWSDI